MNNDFDELQKEIDEENAKIKENDVEDADFEEENLDKYSEKLIKILKTRLNPDKPVELDSKSALKSKILKVLTKQEHD